MVETSLRAIQLIIYIYIPLECLVRTEYVPVLGMLSAQIRVSHVRITAADFRHIEHKKQGKEHCQ